MTDPQERYLWNREGEPDPEVARLEELLAALRPEDRGMPSLPPRGRRPRWAVVGSLVAAGLLLATLAALPFLDALSRRPLLRVVQGRVLVDGVRVQEPTRLGSRSTLEIERDGQAVLELTDLGRVRIEGSSRLRIGGASSLHLEHGSLRASILAEPGRFRVMTPSVTVVDLGCEFRLEIEEDGSGVMEVEKGWVGLVADGQDPAPQARVPAGGRCDFQEGGEIGVPLRHDAPAALQSAADDWSAGAGEDERRSALGAVAAAARPRDAVTLWHLLVRIDPASRELLYDRLATVAPPPSGISREAVLRGEPAALESWWTVLGPPPPPGWPALETAR